MLYGALSTLHILLVVFNFCFNKDNHKQTIHDVKFNINNTNSAIVINCINFFYVNLFSLLVKFSLHEKTLP